MYGQCITKLVGDRCGVPVAVENDGKCGALSEAWNGSLKDCRDGAVIILGSGIAGGLIKDHKIHGGKWCNAGEFSYFVSKPGDYSMFSSAFMQIGMLGVTYKLCKLKNLDYSVQDAAPTLQYMDTLLPAAQNAAPKGEPLKIKADGKKFFEWIYAGDKDALQVYDEFKQALAALVFNIQICFAPDKIVIGGGLSKEPPILPDLKAELEKYNQGYGISDKMQAEVVLSTYRGEANLCGAAYNYIIRNT
jgi:predicted NBD/HSP70 family sugar kinase